MPMPIRSTSAGSTPTHTPQDCLAGVGGDVLEAFAQGEPHSVTLFSHTALSPHTCTCWAPTHWIKKYRCVYSCSYHVKKKCISTENDLAPSLGVPRNLRNDLLVAADSITNTMSSLVKELHSGQSSASSVNLHVLPSWWVGRVPT